MDPGADGDDEHKTSSDQEQALEQRSIIGQHGLEDCHSRKNDRTWK